LFDNDKMIQKAFKISIKVVNRNITVVDHTKGVLLISKKSTKMHSK